MIFIEVVETVGDGHSHASAEQAEAEGFAKQEEEPGDRSSILQIIPIGDLLPSDCELLKHPAACSGIIFQDPYCDGQDECRFIALESQAVHPADISRVTGSSYPLNFLLKHGTFGQKMYMWYVIEPRAWGNAGNPELRLLAQAYYYTQLSPALPPVRQTVREVAAELAASKGVAGRLEEHFGRTGVFMRSLV